MCLMVSPPCLSESACPLPIKMAWPVQHLTLRHNGQPPLGSYNAAVPPHGHCGVCPQTGKIQALIQKKQQCASVTGLVQNWQSMLSPVNQSVPSTCTRGQGKVLWGNRKLGKVQGRGGGRSDCQCLGGSKQKQTHLRCFEDHKLKSTLP